MSLRDLDGAVGSGEPAHYSWREVFRALECPTPGGETVPTDENEVDGR